MYYNVRRTYFIFFLLISMTKIENWKTITTDEEGEPVLKYDSHHDEIINIRTGEVIQK